MPESTVLFFIWLVVAFVLLSIVGFWTTLVFIKRKDDFQKTFGFPAPDRMYGELDFRVVQPDVDRVLTGLARELDRVTRRKVELEDLFQERLASDEFEKMSPSARLGLIRVHRQDQADLAGRIGVADRDFDRARFLAKGFEFEVRATLREYLPPEDLTTDH